MCLLDWLSYKKRDIIISTGVLYLVARADKVSLITRLNNERQIELLTSLIHRANTSCFLYNAELSTD